MDVYVLNKQFQRIGLIDSYNSLIWNHVYYEYGDFELYTKCNTDILNLLEKDFYLVRECDIIKNGYKNVMIIKDFHITTNVESGDFLTVTGVGLKSIVSKRVLTNQTNMSGYIHSCIKQLLTENIIAPEIPERKISNFVFKDIYQTTETMTRQSTGKNLGELIVEICKNYGMGWDVEIKDNDFIFYLYKGVDHSYSQKENNFVVFSREFDNLLSSDYTEVNSDFANVAIVAGEGEGVQRKKVVVGTASGIERCEIWVDSRNSSTNDGQISDIDYIAMLTQEGNEKLTEQGQKTTFSGEADTTKTYVLHKDFDLGDIVQVVNDYGITKTARITEIVESVDENGTNVLPTFQYERSE